jgi:NAD(P)-dependent dehydrogenase (short-subunit alcohol dehydrogenase family)
MSLFADQLLAGSAIGLAGGVSGALRPELIRLGARVEEPERGLELGADWVRAHAPLQALVYDAGPAFGDGGQEGLRASVDQGWDAIHAVANGALIPGEVGGRIVLIAPRANAGSFAQAARAALENLARTLSVEWARYAITTTAIAPGASTTDEQLAMLVAFLISPAGDYLSGCRLELGAGTGGG